MTFKFEPDWQGEAHYTIIFDGGSEGNPGPGYGSYAIITRTGQKRIYRLNFGEMTSNEAEYTTLISALTELINIIERASKTPEDFTVEIQGDSTLVINQILGVWKTREPNLKEFRDRTRKLLGRFKAWRFVKVPRAQVKKELGH